MSEQLTSYGTGDNLAQSARTMATSRDDADEDEGGWCPPSPAPSPPATTPFPSQSSQAFSKRIHRAVDIPNPPGYVAAHAGLCKWDTRPVPVRPGKRTGPGRGKGWLTGAP